MKQITFETTKKDSALIRGIVKRAADDWGASGHELDRLSCSMDITACHGNGCPLRLSELLDAPAHDFAHDVAGIMRHLNRKTGKLGGCFSPRFSAPEPVADCPHPSLWCAGDYGMVEIQDAPVLARQNAELRRALKGLLKCVEGQPSWNDLTNRVDDNGDPFPAAPWVSARTALKNCPEL